MQEMSNNLRKQFGDVISQAQLGNFSTSVDESTLHDENLKDLASNINTLLSNISYNVTNVREALAAISQGNISYEMNNECSGIFADLQSDINLTTSRLKDFYFDKSFITLQILNVLLMLLLMMHKIWIVVMKIF